MKSLMPSFTYGEALGNPKTRAVLVSLLVNNTGTARSNSSWRSPRIGCEAVIDCAPHCFSEGIDAAGFDHAHVLRNHSVGRRCTIAASGPRFHTLIRIKISSGVAFAYSMKISK